MDETQNPPNDTPADESTNSTAAAPGADETFGWTADDAADGQASTGTTAERMVAQLQAMIDTIATQAGPVVRQVGIKAAELAAAAADRAGPIAHKAADATADASVRIAERSRVIAADLRRDVAAAAGGGSDGNATATAVADEPEAPSEPVAGDDPGEDAR